MKKMAVAALFLIFSSMLPAEDRGDIASGAFDLRMSGRTGAAIKLLEETVCADPSNAPAQFELARDYFYTLFDTIERSKLPLKQRQNALKSRLNSARNAINQAIKADPDNPRYHYWSGVIGTYILIFDAHSVWTIASVPFVSRDLINSYEMAIRLKPDFYQARQELMGCYDRLPWYFGGNKSKAEEQAKILEQMDPVYGAKARCEISPRKSPQEKIAIWQSVAAKLPDSAAAAEGLAQAYMDAEQMQQAVEYANKALKLSPSRGIVLLPQLARRYANIGQYEKAEKTIRRLIDAEPALPPALQAHGLRQLAAVKRKQNKSDEAASLEKEADRLDPTRNPLEYHCMAFWDLHTPPKEFLQ